MALTSASWVLPSHASSPAVARSHVAQACAGLARDLVEITLLLTSEVVTNAVVHGKGQIRMSLARDDRTLRIEVEDESPSHPVAAQRGGLADGGRGLILLESLASEWGTVSAGPEGAAAGAGKRVWFQMRVSH
jgi:anti-sigma regulatory factor (Ser/Thr protein kinase)